MNIGYLIPEFPGQTHVFFWRELLAMRAAGGNISLISTRQASEDACRHAFCAEGRAETYYVFPPHGLATIAALLTSFWRLPAAIGYVLSLKETPLKKRLRLLVLILCALDLKHFARQRSLDHIHVHSCANAAYLVALCKILGGPAYSLTLHGDLPVYGRDHAKKMQRADFVAVVGRHLKLQVEQQVGLPSSKIQETFMGLDTQAFVPADRSQSKVKSLHLVTIARLNPAKGHVYSLGALRMAIDALPDSDLRYSIAGAGPNEDAVRAEIIRLKLQDHVQMLGTLPEDAVRELLRTADAFVLPSVGLGEAWPVSVMEAMACGLPVISSIIGATPEMIRSGEDGLLIQQRDEQGLAEAMIRLAIDLDFRLKMGEAARESAVARFDVRVSAGRLLTRIQSHVEPAAKQFTSPAEESLEGATV